MFKWASERDLPIAFVLAGGYTSASMATGRLTQLHRMTIEAAARHRRKSFSAASASLAAEEEQRPLAPGEPTKSRGEPLFLVRPPKLISEMTTEQLWAFAETITDAVFEEMAPELGARRERIRKKTNSEKDEAD